MLVYEFDMMGHMIESAQGFDTMDNISWHEVFHPMLNDAPGVKVKKFILGP